MNFVMSRKMLLVDFMGAEIETPYDKGWGSGYHDEFPECPYDENSEESIEWWKGYSEGSRES